MQGNNFSKLPKIILLTGGISNHEGFGYQTWYTPLKNISRKIIAIDTTKYSLLNGKNNLNRELLRLVKKEKPDYIFFNLVTSDEFYLDTFLRIKTISPKTKLVNFMGDDDTLFETFSRYCSLFFDYFLISQLEFFKKYKQDKIKNIFPFPTLVNTSNFRDLSLKKTNDVVFVGMPKHNRYEDIKYLKDNGINIKLYGRNWGKYPEFKDIYFGIPSHNNFIKIINSSKINLGFTKDYYGKVGYKTRMMEVPACNSFALTEFFEGYLNFFKEDKEMVFFRDKEDLLKKVRYYLQNDKEREEIAKRAYKKVIKNYDIKLVLKNFIKTTINDSPIKKIYETNKKIICLSNKDLKLSISKLKQKIKNYDYISFKTISSKSHQLKNFLQAHSLEKTGKDISCCTYYISSKHLGNYLYYYLEHALMVLNKKEFLSLTFLDQLMITKESLIKNYQKIKQRDLSFIDKINTAFVSFPLVNLRNLSLKDPSLAKAFSMKFLHKLYTLFCKKKSSVIKYSYWLLIEILKGNFLIFRVMLDELINRNRINSKIIRE